MLTSAAMTSQVIAPAASPQEILADAAPADVYISVDLRIVWLPSLTLIETYLVKRRMLAFTAVATRTGTGGHIRFRPW
ncbi:hypothetical protein MY4038_003968 [Beauveria bassiana]